MLKLNFFSLRKIPLHPKFINKKRYIKNIIHSFAFYSLNKIPMIKTFQIFKPMSIFNFAEADNKAKRQGKKNHGNNKDEKEEFHERKYNDDEPNLKYDEHPILNYFFSKSIKTKKLPCFELYSSQIEILNQPMDFYLAIIVSFTFNNLVCLFFN